MVADTIGLTQGTQLGCGVLGHTGRAIARFLSTNPYFLSCLTTSPPPAFCIAKFDVSMNNRAARERERERARARSTQQNLEYLEGLRSKGKREGKGVLYVKVREGITWPPSWEDSVWDSRYQELGMLSIVLYI